MSADGDRAVLVASIPPIMSSIMKNLTAKQLNTCAQVCTMWRDIAQIEKKRRLFCWIFESKCDQKGLHELYHCPYECKEGYLTPFGDKVSNLPIEPAFALIFCTKSMVNQPKAFDSHGYGTRKRKFNAVRTNSDMAFLRLRVIESFLPRFPPSCEVGFCTAHGVTDMHLNKEMKYCPSMATVLFPRMPGVGIHRFVMNGLSTEYSDITGVPPDQPIKCLLIFHYDRERYFLDLSSDRLTSHYMFSQNGEIAIGGAFVNNVCFPTHKVKRGCKSYGIAFTGENVRAASLLIKIRLGKQEEIAERLELFRQSGLLSGECVAFVFASLDREFGSSFRADMESGIFRNMYPSVPLFAVFGKAQFGRSYVPGVLKRKSVHSNCQSNVFVLLSFKKP